MSYDAVGELTSVGTNSYTWDARHHLAQIKQGRTVAATFAYDAFGRRESKTIGASTTAFLYDGLNPVQERSGGGSVTANLLTGLNIDEYFTRTASATTSTFLADAFGSTIGFVTANGGPIAISYTYQPFGTTTQGGASNTNLYQFTGRENDGTGLYYYRARYYSGTFQRFISQDPIGFRGKDANLYGYVTQDPIFGIDPLGLSGYFLRFFVGIGAEIEVGTNPDNTRFAALDFGFGEEVAAGYDSNATSPGYNQNGPASCSIGSFAQGGVHIGGADLGLGAETGTEFGQNGAAPYSSSGPSAGVSGPPGNGIDVGGSAGGRISLGGS
jgi:RHS repeat-associated protein